MPGGGAVYAALGMALWNGSAAVVAPLGPEYPREHFPALDFSRTRAVAHTMRNWGLYEADGTRHFVSRRDSLPWEAFSPDASDLDGGTYGACHLAPLPWSHTVALIDALRARGATISLDLHDRVLAAVASDELTRTIAGVDVFLPSRQDTDVLFPGGTAPLVALRRLRERFPGVPVIGVKCGAEGALLHAVGSPDAVRVPAAAPEVVDATGAGDAFCGGFLAAYARTGDVREGALAGTVAASYAVAGIGPLALAAAERAAADAWLAALRPRLERVALAAP